MKNIIIFIAYSYWNKAVPLNFTATLSCWNSPITAQSFPEIIPCLATQYLYTYWFSWHRRASAAARISTPNFAASENCVWGPSCQDDWIRRTWKISTCVVLKSGFCCMCVSLEKWCYKFSDSFDAFLKYCLLTLTNCL